MISMTQAAVGRGVIWGLLFFFFEGRCQAEEGFKCPEKRIFYQHIILSTDMGKVGLILNFRHQPVFEGSAGDRKELALSRARL